jgi:hypothetical protein
MAKHNAPAKLTGGQGFNYEDHVAARFLLGLLGATHPLGSDVGRLVRIDWQAADAGWKLEDLALTFADGGSERAAGVSIKNHKQVTESGFPAAFTEACWEQWLGVGTSRRFQVDRDHLVLVAGVLAEGVRTAWEKTLGEAIELAAAPDRLVTRLQPPTAGAGGAFSSDTQRSLFESLRCPGALRSGATGDVETAKLVRHIRLVHLDFESTPSHARSDALAASRAVLRSGSADEALSLWDFLVGVAARKRGRGGSIDLPELLARLRARFALRDHPDYRHDFTELDRRSRERFEVIGLAIGGRARLPRRSARGRLRGHFREGRTCVLVGESGVGKSALARGAAGAGDRLVWLTADLFQSGRGTAFEAALGLRHPLAQVVAASPVRCLVVFDGLEGFSEPGLELVARLVASLRAACAGRVRVALTVQPDGLTRLRAAFASAAVPPDSWEVLAVQAPGRRSIDRLLARCPGLSPAALRPEFRSLLRNLKVFDWAVRLQAGGGLADADGVGCLTALIDRLWAHFVEGGPDGLGRAGLLKRLAAAEADRLLLGQPLSELGTPDLALLPALEAGGVVCRLDERVRFVHDMFSDWARLKYLVEQGLPESEPTIRRAATAGWYRAVRLYAQRLLERPVGGIDRWRECVRALGTGARERVIVRDLFLEALVLANDPRTLLAAAWPALVEGDGELLRLLIDRFGYVGTVPDQRVLAAIPDRAARLEHLIRVPFEPLWEGVLPVLADHPEDVIRCALAPAAKLLRLWLSNVTPARRSTKPLRRAAARLTLTLAREVQALEAEGRGSVEDDVRTDVYVALLWAAPEHPAEVAELCLELANRRPEAEPIRLRREAAQERAHRAAEQLSDANPQAAELLDTRPTPERLFGPRRPPWPDGPARRVDQSFQAACLDWQAVLPLAVNRPEQALEVLLAALIEHPTYRDYGDSEFQRDKFGLADARTCEPPFHHQGPFRALLRCDPTTAELALTLIIRVVNFATERWREHHARLVARYGGDGPGCVRVPDGGWVECPGDPNVLHWHGGWRTHPAVLSSMLMAVEKWLYDEADAGRAVDRWVGRILSEGRSAALVGVLVALGKYKPELLAGPLRPLIGACEVYTMDHRALLERSGVAFWSLDWMRLGEGAWNTARDWHTMPHRKAELLPLVQQLVLQHEAVRADAVDFYRRWQERLRDNPDDPAPRAAVNHFAVVTRYLEAAAGGADKLPEFRAWLEARQEEAAAADRRLTEELLPLTLGPRCRKRLDEGSPLPDGELVPFLASLRCLAERPDPPDGETRIADAVMGGVAVLLILHRDWVREDVGREDWCRGQLRRYLDQPPGRGPYESPDSAGNWNWDAFAAECGVTLLAEDPAEPLARQLVALGLVSFRYTTVAATVCRAYRLRSRLGGEFDRVKGFVGEWAACLWAWRWSQEWQLCPERVWETECVPRIEAFVRGGPVPTSRPVAAVDAAGRGRVAALFDERRARWEQQPDNGARRVLPGQPDPPSPELDGDLDGDQEVEPEHPSQRHGVPSAWPGLDPNYLRAGFAWLEAATSEETAAASTLATVLDLLAVTRRTIPAAPRTGRRQSRFPSKYDEWVFERVAATLIRVGCRGRGDELWRPVLAVGVRGEWWVRYFLVDWFQVARGPAVKPGEFVALWGRMIGCALDDPDWDAGGGGWRDVEEVVTELLGFDMGRAVLGGDARYARPVGGLLPLFERTAGRWFCRPRVATGFCRFALTVAGAELLLPGIRWLAAAEPSWSEWAWERDGLAGALTDTLRAALERHRHAVAADAQLRGAYLSLCSRLVSLGHHDALALRERVASGGDEVG